MIARCHIGTETLDGSEFGVLGVGSGAQALNWASDVKVVDIWQPNM